MMIFLENHYESMFYGYCNGDLLFYSSFVPTLYSLAQRIEKGELLQKVVYDNLI